MKLMLELVDGTTYTFTAAPGTETFRGAIDKAVQQKGFLSDKEFFPLDNVKRVSLKG